MKNVKRFYSIVFGITVVISVVAISYAYLISDLNRDGIVNNKDFSIMVSEFGNRDPTDHNTIVLNLKDHTIPLKQRKYQVIRKLYGDSHALWYVRPDVWCAILEVEGGFGITQIYVDDVNQRWGTEFEKPTTESDAYVLFTLFNEWYNLRTDTEIIGRWNPDPNYLLRIEPVINRIKYQKETLW